MVNGYHESHHISSIYSKREEHFSVWLGHLIQMTHFQIRMKRMTSFKACYNEKEPFAVMQKENNVRFSENSLQSCSLSAAERQHFPSSGRLVGSSICFFAWRQHDEGFLETDGNCLFTF